MEEFPKNFHLETFKQTILEQDNKIRVQQEEMLKQERSKIVRLVTDGVNNGNKEVIITISDDLCYDMKYILSKELIQRFPGCLWYHCTIGYADVDEFRQVKTPDAYWEYKIVFE